jgi:hypothetical protein
MSYRVLVDDNFRYMDASQRFVLGEFATYGEAFAVCKEMVDRFLRHEYVAGMPASTLYLRYIMFGRDPFIVNAADGGEAQPGFSAWEYAKARCVDLCRDVPVSAPEGVALTA